MDNKSSKEVQKPYTYSEWQTSIFSEMELKTKIAESTIQKFMEVALNSPAHAIEYYSEDVIIAFVTQQELKNINDKLIAHPTVTLYSLIQDKITYYLQHYKNQDFRHNSTSLITNAINLWRNMAYANLFEMFERAVKLHNIIDK